MPFRFTRLPVSDLILVETDPIADPRGVLSELYKRSAFEAAGIGAVFVQENLSRSTRGVLRGLHYQIPPHAQGKLVACLRGEIFDVGVDLRRGSPSYGRWASAALSGENRRMLYVPEGFAHGFCVVSEDADVVYQLTAEYAPAAERGVRWDDPALGIPWPVRAPVLSDRDRALPGLTDLAAEFDYAGRAP
jgi:dTDP-4-dehydrorhamnose 3,5-epimerase